MGAEYCTCAPRPPPPGFGNGGRVAFLQFVFGSNAPSKYRPNNSTVQTNPQVAPFESGYVSLDASGGTRAAWMRMSGDQEWREIVAGRWLKFEGDHIELAPHIVDGEASARLIFCDTPIDLPPPPNTRRNYGLGGAVFEDVPTTSLVFAGITDAVPTLGVPTVNAKQSFAAGNCWVTLDARYGAEAAFWIDANGVTQLHHGVSIPISLPSTTSITFAGNPQVAPSPLDWTDTVRLYYSDAPLTLPLLLARVLPTQTFFNSSGAGNNSRAYYCRKFGQNPPLVVVTSPVACTVNMGSIIDPGDGTTPVFSAGFGTIAVAAGQKTFGRPAAATAELPMIIWVTGLAASTAKLRVIGGG